MMELTIKDLNGKTQLVNVLPNATVGELKQLVSHHFESRASLLKLSSSTGQILDQDGQTVRDYGLSSGSTLMLLICSTPVPFQVFVKNEKGQIKTYDITENETVDQLMRKISQKEGTPLDQLRLIYGGQQLSSGRNLQDYDIVPGGTIHMTLRLRGG